MISIHGVAIYSPLNQKDTPHYWNGIYTGIEWQCVELARRYLIIRHHITFPSIPNAYDIFSLPFFMSLDGKKIQIQNHLNGSPTLPHVGSLLIWNKSKESKTGHVAVVTNVTSHWIEIIQQNEPEPIRILYFYWNFNLTYFIDEPYLVGWINFY
jgi:glutathionylspermidine amidase/synthetase